MMRERDDGGGRRIAKPLNVSLVDDEYREQALVRMRDREEAEAQPAAAQPKPSPFFSNTFTGLVVLLGGLLTLYLFTQTVVFVGTILTYPPYIRYPAMGILGVLVAIVLWSILRLVHSYYRLMRNRQVQLEEIRQLNERRLIEEAASKGREAKALLVNYLRTYDLEDQKFADRLSRAGVTEAELRQLGEQRSPLLVGEFEDTQRWLEEFRDGFQAVQDQAAERIIRKYAVRMGVATAAVPKGLVDALIVTWGGLNMLRELCGVYNLRLGRLGTLVLMGRVFRNVFIAGEMGEVTSAVVEDLSERIHDSVGVTADAFTSAAASAMGKVLGKASEGLVNALLIRRLGYGAMKMLRPMS